MERLSKIKHGILDLVSKGVYGEAEELLAQYEKAVPDDPDVFNIRSVIYTDAGNNSKALAVLEKGLIKYPANFDMHYNLAYLHELQGEYFHAFDRYITASEITAQKHHHKEIMTALEKLQATMKKRVEAAENGHMPENTVLSGCAATRNTTVVDVEIEKCRDNYGFGYGADGWHPFVEQIKELFAFPEIKYEGDSTLWKYFFLFRPKNLQEALMGDVVTDISPLSDSFLALPWERYFGQTIMENKDQPYFFGPYPDSEGKALAKKLLNHYKLVKESGYHPNAFDDSYIRGYLLKTDHDYRFVVCQGHHRLAALAALGYTKIRCKMLDEKDFPNLVHIRSLTKWPSVKNKVYSADTAKAVFYSFFNNNGRERAVGASLVCKDLSPEKQAALEGLGINLKDQFNIRMFNAGLLDDLDEEFANEVDIYWQKHYERKVDPGYYLAFKNLTGKKEPRLIPHRIMRGEIIPILNHREMGRTAYTDKNLYDKLVPTPNSVQNVLKRVRGKYFDSSNNFLASQEAYEVIVNSETDLIIKPSTTDNGIGVSRLNVERGHIYLKNKIIRMPEIEKEWGDDFIVQKRIEQHPVMAKPHPESVNTLRMVTLRWNGEIRNLLTYVRIGTDGRPQDNVKGLACGIKDNGEFFNYASDRKFKRYDRHPTSGYDFNQYARVPNYECFKKFVRDLHKEVLHHDYICWDIVVGIDEQPIFLELNFWGTIWLYQLRCEVPFFGDVTEALLAYVKAQRDQITKGVGRAGS
ncbi:MAG: hypothetical protein GX335_02290 [Firmicutes bacterium]|nr:hypothetical protein [Bacillota bacterium]